MVNDKYPKNLFNLNEEVKKEMDRRYTCPFCPASSTSEVTIDHHIQHCGEDI